MTAKTHQSFAIVTLPMCPCPHLYLVYANEFTLKRVFWKKSILSRCLVGAVRCRLDKSTILFHNNNLILRCHFFIRGWVVVITSYNSEIAMAKRLQIVNPLTNTVLEPATFYSCNPLAAFID